MKYLITQYFEEAEGGCRLKPVDNNPRKKQYYISVSIPYIHKYVCKEKFKTRSIARFLYDMHTKGSVRALHCGEVNTIVFTKFSGYWTYERNTGYGKYGYTHFLEHIKSFK